MQVAADAASDTFAAFSFLPTAGRAPRDGARSSIKPSSVFLFNVWLCSGTSLPAEPVPDGRFAAFCVLPRAVASRPLFWPPFPTTHGRARGNTQKAAVSRSGTGSAGSEVPLHSQTLNRKTELGLGNERRREVLDRRAVKRKRPRKSAAAVVCCLYSYLLISCFAAQNSAKA